MTCKIIDQKQDSERVTIVANFTEGDFSETYTFFVPNIDPETDPEKHKSLSIRIKEKIQEETDTYSKRKAHIDSMEKINII